MIIIGRLCLLLAGLSSGLLALMHIIIMIIGETAYRSFGGVGEEFADLLLNGSITPTIITSGITICFAVFTLYGLSGAKIITRLPLLRIGILFIATVYLLRGLINLPYYSIIIANGQKIDYSKSIIYDSISFTIGLFYLFGIIREWKVVNLSKSEIKRE